MVRDLELSCFYSMGFLNIVRGREQWAPFFVNLHSGVQVFSDCILLCRGCSTGRIDQNIISMVFNSILDR